MCFLHALHGHDTIDYAAELANFAPGRDALELILTAYDAAAADDAGEAGAVLDIVAGIVRRLFERGHVGSFLGADVGPMQVTLLRVLADVLQERVDECKKAAIAPLPRAAVAPLAWQLTQLAAFARDVMESHMRGDATDLRGLIRAHVALVALLDALTSVATSGHEAGTGDAARLAELREDRLLEETVRLLHTAHAFFPAQSPFRGAPAGDAPDGHVLSSTGRASAADAPARPALHTLKRSIIRLIGALAFCPPGTKRTQAVASVQDRVREAGGLMDVLGATVLDESNPCASTLTDMREHAIFALRALLDRNQASQALIAELRPVEPDAAS